MPRIPTIQVERAAGVQRTPGRFDEPSTPDVGRTILGIAERLADVNRRLQRQQDATELAGAAAQFGADIKLGRSVLEKEPIQNELDVELRQKRFGEMVTEVTKRAEKGLTSNTAKRAFRAFLDKTVPGEAADVTITATKQRGESQIARLDQLEDEYSRAAVLAGTPEARDVVTNTYLALINEYESSGTIKPVDAERRRQAFHEKTQADYLTVVAQSDPERALELDAKGTFDKVDPVKKVTIISQASRVLDAREARAQREADRLTKEQHDDIKIEIGTAVSEGRLDEARNLLQFYASHRMLPAPDVEHLRRVINEPGPVMSDRREASRILLDVESINPSTTEGEIDSLYTAGRVSLGDATKAKNQLRETRKALQNTALTEITRKHNQAEQELRADTGVRPGVLASAIQDDPAGRVYAALLSELRKRSQAFGGTEDPLAIVESFRPRVRDALGKPARLKPSEIQGLYPDWQSLERAWRDGRISEDQFQDEKRRRSGVPVAPTPAAPAVPTPRKRF